MTDENQILPAIRSVISTKVYGIEEQLSKIVTGICLASYKPTINSEFNVDNVRTAKILGGNLKESFAIKGLVFTRETEGAVMSVSNCKVAVFSCPLDPIASSDTKSTVLIKSA